MLPIAISPMDSKPPADPAVGGHGKGAGASQESDAFDQIMAAGESDATPVSEAVRPPEAEVQTPDGDAISDGDDQLPSVLTETELTGEAVAEKAETLVSAAGLVTGTGGAERAGRIPLATLAPSDASVALGSAPVTAHKVIPDLVDGVVVPDGDMIKQPVNLEKTTVSAVQTGGKQALMPPDVARVTSALAIPATEEPPKPHMGVSEVLAQPSPPMVVGPAANMAGGVRNMPLLPIQPDLIGVSMPDSLPVVDEIQPLMPLSGEGAVGSTAVLSDVARPIGPLLPAQLSPGVMRQMAEMIAQAPDRGIEIALNPEELGRVRLSLSGSDGAMVVTVTAERAETLELFRRNIGALEQELTALGYRDLAFDFGQSQGGQKDDSSAHGSLGAEMDPQAEPIQMSVTLIALDKLDMRL